MIKIGIKSARMAREGPKKWSMSVRWGLFVVYAGVNGLGRGKRAGLGSKVCMSPTEETVVKWVCVFWGLGKGA
jgi:hypothetical protein